MSRSLKRSPFSPNAGARSEKDDKRMAHRRLRAHFRTAAGSSRRDDDEEGNFDFVERSEAHSNVWDMAKDGRHRLRSQREVGPLQRHGKLPAGAGRKGYHLMGK